MRLFFDMDDVIFAYVWNFLFFYNLANKTNFTMADFVNYHTWESLGIPQADGLKWEQLFAGSQICHDLPPIGGALEVLTRLKQKHELHILTARWTPDRHEKTLSWLDRFLPGIFLAQNVYFTHDHLIDGQAPCKSLICQKLRADVMIDDRYTYIEQCALVSIEAILFQPDEYHWNQLPDVLPLHVHWAKNWWDVEREIEDLERLSILSA